MEAECAPVLSPVAFLVPGLVPGDRRHSEDVLSERDAKRT